MNIVIEGMEDGSFELKVNGEITIDGKKHDIDAEINLTETNVFL